MTDPERAEQLRRRRLEEINLAPGTREALEAKHGRVYSTVELADEFEITGFMAPFVVVRRRSDDVVGSLEFQHNPRFFFNFVAD